MAHRPFSSCALISVTMALAGCRGENAVEPSPTPPPPPSLGSHRDKPPSAALITLVRELAAARNVGPLPAPPAVRSELVRLGKMLAFDRILSGNKDISCMTCHLPALATGDGRSLSIGQGASGLGPERVHPQGKFIPRNAPPMFNLHMYTSLFWDGRVSTDSAGNFLTPAGAQLTPDMTAVFEFGPLSALALFPVLSREEMRAFRGNELAALGDERRPAIWNALMKRLGAIGEYRILFQRAYPGTPFNKMTFAHASNAIAGFMLAELTFNDSPWDRFINGNNSALNEAQLKGAETFLATQCAICHRGPAFTGNRFQNVAVAQVGPGLGDGPSGRDDFGRMRVTGDPADRYRFRTTALRNVELTGPWGHDGAFVDLRRFVDHYSESDIKLRRFKANTLEPLLQGTLLANVDDILATRDENLAGMVLTPEQVDQILVFMRTLTDPRARSLRQRIAPLRVPSGLPVDGGRLFR